MGIIPFVKRVPISSEHGGALDRRFEEDARENEDEQRSKESRNRTSFGFDQLFEYYKGLANQEEEEKIDSNKEIELIIGIIEQINEMIITCLERMNYTENQLINMSLIKLKTLYGYTLDHKMFEMEFTAGCHGVDITEKKPSLSAQDIEKANELLKEVNKN